MQVEIDINGGGDVVQFTGKKRPDDKGLMLVPPAVACRHQLASFTVDVDAGKCTCRTCGGDVSPMFVLEQLMRHESQWQQTRSAYQEEMKRLAERRKTKCQHCHKMTRISNA